jgi:hypothetical protein
VKGGSTLAWADGVSRLWLVLKEHRPSLYPTEEWDELLDIKIAKLSLDGMDDDQISYVKAVQSGLHLWNESLDQSHTLSQDIHNPTGSYWHGIMHRMEGDYSNSKYWFRHTGEHAVFPLLLEQTKEIYRQLDPQSIGSPVIQARLDKLVGGLSWDPYAFVDLVEQQVTVVHNERADAVLIELQRIEMKLLLQYSYERSGGTPLEL